MEIINGNNNSFINVCWGRSKINGDDLDSSISKCLEKKRVATRNSKATYICSKVKAQLDKDNKIIKIEKLK